MPGLKGPGNLCYTAVSSINFRAAGNYSAILSDNYFIFSIRVYFLSEYGIISIIIQTKDTA
jgi:hypothetical protein